jgi:dolichyl-diphosphooligosaccharide--protein glycosyltransferase
MEEVARWLRDNTPQTKGWLDPGASPEYGVVAPWDMGHILNYVGRRPTSSGNFGDDLGPVNFNLVQDYYAANEANGSSILDRLKARYVVVPYYTGFLKEATGPDSLYRALYDYDGSEWISPEHSGDVSVRALERHRLVYDQALTKGERGNDRAYKVFEHVAGARIVGRATPGSEVRASVSLITQSKRALVYETRTVADAAGNYELRVPYANPHFEASKKPQEPTRAVRVASHYRLSCDGGEVDFKATEQAVLRGDRVLVAQSCPPTR